MDANEKEPEAQLFDRKLAFIRVYSRLKNNSMNEELLLKEKLYENALVVEFGLRKIPFAQQPRFDVLYKQVKVGEYVPDLIVFNAVVVDTKVIDAITDHERGQRLNYRKITGLKVGVILNFKRAKLEWERIVLDRNR